ncbi:DUF4878 domain-containing protein [Mycobacterium sp. ITM-2016-00318]|uniref:Rv0361 family membrane protein n=1 Tax=Mycobacterium sp. ITM-2016-00318 TaxID=2099693 RepID=UPI000CF9FAF0|nr:DUF4878 domain-containing protein [Mycobacterium sp. ITM-2016-00318]WNG93299.1 DUF4878 domain-containing protein [Mycobacterium sp. ITM-2016-00318]
MSNPSGPEHGDEPVVGSADKPADAEQPAGQTQPPQGVHDAPTQAAPIVEEHPTEVMAVEETGTIDTGPPTEEVAAERRYTAPSGMDSSATKFIEKTADPATEIISTPTEPLSPNKPVAPQTIPPRTDVPPPPPPQGRRRSWGWVVALILVIAALAAVAILGTLLLTRDSESKESQEEMVRSTIENFDVAVQNGDLATLRSITCGTTRDSYVNYDERAWADTHARVAAAKQYPVVSSIDQIVVNGDHAEANVTTFMAYAPQTRSTRSFDLQFRDDQWKICQAPSG